MARPHTTNGEYTNPEVRFERTDIALGTVLKFGVALIVLIAVSIAIAWWLFVVVTRYESKKKKTDLPAAAVDSNRLPPQPRLEGIEDVREKNVKLMPPRARDYLAAQEELLSKGNLPTVQPIDQAIDEIKLPSRKGPGTAPPANFTRRLPSKAAAGREATGGQ